MARSSADPPPSATPGLVLSLRLRRHPNGLGPASLHRRPHVPVAFFRSEAWGNAYVVLARMIVPAADRGHRPHAVACECGVLSLFLIFMGFYIYHVLHEKHQQNHRIAAMDDPICLHAPMQHGIDPTEEPCPGVRLGCPSCRGRAMTIEMLRKSVPQPLVNRLWQRARSGEYPANRSCPACKRRMAEVPIALAADTTLHLDVCTGCHVIWFDPQEFESLPNCPPKRAQSEPLSPEARGSDRHGEARRPQPHSLLSGLGNDAPEHWWHFAVALCGIPIEYNDSPLKNRPIVTWLLAAVIAVVSLAAFRDLRLP